MARLTILQALYFYLLLTAMNRLVCEMFMQEPLIHLFPLVLLLTVDEHQLRQPQQRRRQQQL
jgi:hypothetical protein